MKHGKLIAHILDNKREVGTRKGKTFQDSIKWNKREWAISEQARNQGFIFDRKGVAHLYIDVNLADKIFYFLTPTDLNLYDHAGKPIDKCGECGGNISIDAQANRILNNKTIYKSFWGMDNSYVLLLLIMGIVAIILGAGLFYMIGENQKTQQILQQYLKPVPNTVTSNFLVPYIQVIR